MYQKIHKKSLDMYLLIESGNSGQKGKGKNKGKCPRKSRSTIGE